MSGRSWTTEQQAAIDARGASLVVSAAAGSGKTAVLVERVSQLLADTIHPCPAGALVVVTFTKDAAAEVRARLNQALAACVQSHPDDLWLREQLVMLQSAKISTIHSFCYDLLREQFAALDLPAGFRVMDDSEENGLRLQAAEETLDALAADKTPEAAVRRTLLYGAFCGKDDSPLLSLLLKLYTQTESVPFGGDLLAGSALAYEDGRMAEAVCAAIRSELDEMTVLCRRAAELCGELGAEKAQQVVNAEAVWAAGVLEALDAFSGAPADLRQVADAMQRGVEGTMSFPRKNIDVPKREMAKALRARAKKTRETLQKRWVTALTYAEKDFPRQAEILRALDVLLREFSARLAEMKRQRGALGYGDAMTLTLSLLAERKADGSIVKTPLAEQLSQQYACIMIDEFQDADDQQDLIFHMLSRGGDAEHFGDNVFVVGDSKQCIYQFRNANPRNFAKALDRSAPFVTHLLTKNTRILLNKNFRSAAEVVGLVNAVFAQMMTREVGDIVYDDSQALVQGAKYDPLRRPAELLLVEQNEDKAAEARAVAARIRWHLDNHTQVQGKEGLRDCTPGDFMILYRYATHAADYADALQAAGIPFVPAGQDDYLQAPEILVLLDLLRAVDNPLLDIPLAGAMLSPLHGFTLDELTELRIGAKKSALFPAVQRAAEDEQTAPVLRGKCKRFLDFLEAMRLCSAMETPEQLIRRIYSRTDFLGMMQILPGGMQRKANLRALLVHARNFEENNSGGLSAFLRWVDGIRERGSDLTGGDIPPGTSDMVQLKTIHSSKGLEAPFVILVETDAAFGRRGEPDVFQYRSGLGFGFILQDPGAYTKGRTVSYLALEQANKKDQLSEEMRLLYVALTRARERLIVTVPHRASYGKSLAAFAGEQDAFGGQTDQLTRAAGSMCDWLMMALMRGPSAEMLRREMGLECGTLPGLPMLDLVTLRMETAPADMPDTPPVIPQPDPDLTALLKARCSWHYESPEAGLTAKYGVSELAKEEDFSAPLRRPSFVREQHGLSGAERGTAVHTFLQHADFALACKDVVTEADRLESLGRLTKKQAEAVRKSGVEAFFRSELYLRLTKAEAVWREKKFTVRLADLELTGDLAALGEAYAGTKGMLTGIMDLVFREPDGLVLVDYKTDHVRNAADLREKYADQLRLYAGALRLLFDLPVKARYLYSLSLNEVVPV